MAKQLLRCPQVTVLIGLSRSEIYRLMAIRQFPQSVKIGRRAVAWDSDKVQAWIKNKIK